MNTKLLRLILTQLTLLSVFASAGDLKITKQNLAEFNCAYFEFLSTIDSKIFDIIDSAHGEAYIAKDGRYFVEIGPDIFIFDGDSLYSYFWSNNQVIIEKPDPGDPVSSEISFVMKLNEWYDSKALKEKNLYKLTRKNEIGGDIPDSMTIKINGQTSNIELIEYFDINGDLNCIEIINQKFDSVCYDNKFRPNFPDSVEKIRF